MKKAAKVQPQARSSTTRILSQRFDIICGLDLRSMRTFLLDHCQNCRGFWLDGGELKSINRDPSELRSQRGLFEEGLNCPIPIRIREI